MRKTVVFTLVFILFFTILPKTGILLGETFSSLGSVLSGGIEAGEFLNPQGIFVDKNGNIFVVDKGNYRIQVFDRNGKFIRMFGGKDYLYTPSDVAVLMDGNIIVLDSYNQATTGSGIAVFSQDGRFIKKINSFGEDDTFNAPSNIAVDNEGNVFISDTGNNRVLVFDRDLKFVKEFGRDELNSPKGIAVDDKNVYVSDFGNYRIAIFSKSDGKLINSITEFTVKRNGNDETRSPTPLGISIDNNGNLYFVDADENIIVIFGSDNKEKQTIEKFGTGKGEFVNPYGVTVFDNTIYVSDEKLSRVLAFDTNGNYKFGIYSAIYKPHSVSEPKGISEDNNGNILICDEGTGRILRIDEKFSIEDMDFSNSNIPFTLGDNIGQFPFLIYPQKIQEDAEGNIYVLDYGATIGKDLGACSRILKFSSDLKYKSIIVDPENFRFITDFIVDKESIFLTALSGVFKLDLNGKIITTNTSLKGLEQIAKGNDGYLYIADGVSSIEIVDTDLKLIKKIGEGSLVHPQGVAISNEGDIYVADTGNLRIVAFDKNGNYKFSFGKFGIEENEFINPIRIFIKDKDIFVSDPYASTVKVFDLSGNFKRYVASSKFNFNEFVYPKNIATNSSGMLAILDGYLGRVYLYYNGNYLASFNIFSDYSKRFSNFMKENELISSGIALGEDNAVYVLNGNDRTITRFYDNGRSVDELFLRDFNPSTFTVSKEGVLYIASFQEEKVIYGEWPKDGIFSKRGEISLSTLRPSNGNPIYPDAIFVRNNILYIADPLNFVVEVFDMKSRSLLTIPIKYPESEITYTPEGVTVDDKGNIYVCNIAFSRIEVYDNKGSLLYTFGERGGPLGDAFILNTFPDAGKGYIGYFLYPSSIAVSNNQLYVADTLNKRIQVFNLDVIPLKTGAPCLTASIEKQYVTLNWKSVSRDDVQGYAIFKGQNGSFKEIARVDATKDSYVDMDVENGATYSYFVRTIFKDGSLSFPTNTVSITVSINVRETTPPNIKIITPNNYSIVNTDSIVIKGNVTDESGIDKITVSGNDVSVNLDGLFNAVVKLTEGINTITIKAIDKAGNETTESLNIICDTVAPQIIINSPDNNSTVSTEAISVSGVVIDKNIGSITINGKQVVLDSNNRFFATFQLQKGTNTITIKAIDKAGNENSKVVTIFYKPTTVITLQIGNPYMTVNGINQEIDPGRGTTPVIIKEWGRTVVPIRAIVEALGGSIEWDNATRKVTITLKDTIIELWIGKPQAKVNGETKWIDETNHKVMPEIINGRTMLPLRFVTENLGCSVEWEPNTKTITIIYQP